MISILETIDGMQVARIRRALRPEVLIGITVRSIGRRDEHQNDRGQNPVVGLAELPVPPEEKDEDFEYDAHPTEYPRATSE